MGSRTISKVLPFLAALALAPAAQAAVAPASHTFADQAVGTVGASQTFTVTPDAATDITGVTFSGDDFLVSSDTCGGSLVASCEVLVRFVPQATGHRTATMTVKSAAGDVGSVSLEGEGIALPQGPQGVQGPTGPAGPTGPDGAQGDPGLKGDPGQKGDPCLSSELACRGPQGVQGALGPDGPQGPQGIPGPPGPKGDKGDTGAQGVQGKIGPACVATNPACKGPRGLRGLRGAQGPPGRDAVIACEVAKTKKNNTPKVICTVRFTNAR